MLFDSFIHIFPTCFQTVFKFVSAITSSLLPEQRPRGGRNQTQAGQQPRARQPTPIMNNTGNNDFDIHDFDSLGRHFGRAANMQLPPPDEESIQTLMVSVYAISHGKITGLIFELNAVVSRRWDSIEMQLYKLYVSLEITWMQQLMYCLDKF